jgi:hypothetical protein
MHLRGAASRHVSEDLCRAVVEQLRAGRMVTKVTVRSKRDQGVGWQGHDGLQDGHTTCKGKHVQLRNREQKR